MLIVGSVSRAALRSDATNTARRLGDVAGIEPAMRSLVQMKSAPCATSISARNDTRPTAMRQYRLRYHGLVPLYISGLVAGAPHGEDDGRIRRVLFDLFPQALDERVHASHGHERLVLPDAGEERLA